MANKNHLIHTKPLSTEEFNILTEVSQDPFAFARFIYLIHPLRGRVKFDLYPYQRKVLWYFLTKRFNIVLKFRQAGITELISLYCLWLAMYHPNKNIVILSLKERVAKKVLRKIKFMYKNLPDFLKVSIINGRTGELGTSSEMEFANGSTIASIPTTEDAGRSEGLSLLVIDEAAIMKWAGIIWAAAFPTLSCVTRRTKILVRGHDKKAKYLRIGDISPKQGQVDISHLGLEALTHKGNWKPITHSIYKGKIETWKLEDSSGNTMECTPAHRFLTPSGWKTAKEVIENNLNILQIDFHQSLNANIGTQTGKKMPNLMLVGRLAELIEQGINSTVELTKIVSSEFNTKYSRKFISKWKKKLHNQKIKITKLRLKKVYLDDIVDIHVQDDHSYISKNGWVNHNTGGSAIVNSTPYGVGNWYHQQWVDACSGGNGFYPIRLKWQMHPERGIEWYNDQRAALGPRRTAQEIDGDFLTSGASVFDLADIRAIEEEFDIWLDVNNNPDFKVSMNGQLLTFKKPKPHERYYIGGDVSSGRSRDYSSFSIMNAKGEEFAAFKGKIHPKRLAKLLMEQGRIYNKALIAPEGNDIGLTTVSEIDDSNYPNLYYARTLLRKKGKKRGTEKDVPGWYTTKENRPNIIAGLEEDIRNGTVLIKDPRFTEEAYTFIYNDQNKAIAMGKGTTKDDDDDENTYTDDSIMAKAITNHIRKGSYRSGVYVPPAK